ncbi:MAG: hypothetical protein ACI4HI_17965 [Lachnospiraceae bacterium]
MKKRFVSTMGLGAMVVFVSILTGCGSTKIDLNKYLDFYFYGYEGSGSARAELNVDQMIEDFPEAFEVSSKDDADYEEVKDDIQGALFGELDSYTDLKNGDTITYQWDSVDKSDALWNKYKVKFTFEDEQKEVSGLEEIEEIDPFESIDVTFSGMDSKGKAKLTGSTKYEIWYSLDKEEGLSNGDVVTVTAEPKESEEALVEQGVKMKENTKEYTVKGLSSYVSKIENISKEMMDKMDKEAQDAIQADISKMWDDPSAFGGMKLLGNYLLVSKTKDKEEHINQLYFVYELKGTNPEITYYSYGKFEDIMVLEDGMCSVDLSSVDIPETSLYGDETFEQNGYVLGGYKDMDSLFNRKVAAQIDAYTYETNIKKK